MSALARYFGDIGISVLGYDRTETELTNHLKLEGVKDISYSDQIDSIPDWFSHEDAVHCLVIYTPAIPKENKILNHFQRSDIEVLKRSEVLGLITRNSYNLSVAGTHGKTTTSCLLSSMLNEGKKHFTAFLGGISSDFNSNYIHALGSEKEINYTVTEADEYDRSFLQLSPKIAGITSMDADHLDIYGEATQIERSFNDFGRLVPEDGRLFYHHSLKDKIKDQSTTCVSYGIDHGEVKASNIRIENGHFVFDWFGNGEKIEAVEMGLPGMHNIENASLAMAMAHTVGVPALALKRALKNFKGVKRRFEYVAKGENRVYIDDYAHHPTELKNIIESVRMLYPKKKITGVFQPHLFSRTRDFMDGFAKELSQLDELFLLDIYPARELPIEGITSQALLEKVQCPKALLTKDELIPRLSESQFDVLLTLGAGDIDQMVQPIKNQLAW